MANIGVGNEWGPCIYHRFYTQTRLLNWIIHKHVTTKKRYQYARHIAQFWLTEFQNPRNRLLLKLRHDQTPSHGDLRVGKNPHKI